MARTSCRTWVSGLRKAIVLRPRGEEADRVDDRSRVEDQLREELPDLADVAKPDEERREDERDAEDEDVELEQERHEQEPVQRGGISFQAMKTATTMRFTPKVIATPTVRRGRDDQPRERQLPQQSLARSTIENMPRLVASAKNV